MLFRRLRHTVATSLAVVLSLAPIAAERPSSASSSATEAHFIDALMAKMTLEEKLGQMSQVSWKDTSPALRDGLVTTGQLGSFLFVTDPSEINRLQHLAVEKSRLHIPLLFGFDVIHGFRTIYPIPLALASSWDPALVEHAQSMAAREASAVGIRWTFAPMVDIARDPRWGRIMEGAGEDPVLGSRMAEAQVRGFQGASLSAPTSILASVKHFAGYGAAAGGRDYDQADISDEQLYNVYLPPFHAAANAGAATFMSAYMDLNGVPATGNRFLLHDTLRNDWGFRGFVVSDWGAVHSLITHGFAANPADAAARAVAAGIDMEMTSHDFRDTLAASVQSGRVPIADIDRAVRAILEAKYNLGLFTNPYTDPNLATTELLSPSQRHEARIAAQRSAVLLRNQAHTLPLSKTLHTLAVIGPLADSQPDTMGSWSLGGHPADAVTVLAGLRNKLGATTQIRFAKGVEIERGQPSIFDPQFPEPTPTLLTPEQRAAAFQQAIDTINQSDAAILVLGEAHNMSGERASRTSLALPGQQQQLLEAAVATGKPITLVLLNGRPLDITWASTHVPAILEAWYPGTEGGNAIADLLVGDATPGGHLPITWPRNVGQVPSFYNHTLSQVPNDRDAMYWDASSAPLYPFGYGLSYASIAITNLQISPSELRADGTLQATVTLRNTSPIDGDQTVQLYTHQRAGSATRPVRELKAFQRLHLAAGETRSITLTLRPQDLAFWSPETRKYGLEPGIFDLWVGDASTASAHAVFTLLP